jgi:DegV family protein with EDD domain
MAQVGIVTDSTSGFSRELMTEYGIRIVSMGFISNSKVYRDYLDITTEEFWKIFPTFKEIPTTSAGGVGDFRAAFLDLAKSTNNIVCITISKVLSATYNAADQAARIVMEEKPGLNIKLIDSKTSSGALSLIVLEAARAARAGKSQDEVIRIVEDMMSRAKYFIILESLKYIMKIGRAPDAKNPDAKTAAIPPISPIMGIVKTDTGVMENLERASNIDDALMKATDLVKNYVDINNPIHFLLHYPDRIDKCEQMKKVLLSKYNCAEMHIWQWAPATIVSCGPVWGLAFYT